MRFADLGIADDQLIGNKIEFSQLFGKRIIIEKIKFRASKYQRNGDSGDTCMLMQVCLVTFNPTPDSQGDYFVKNEDGTPRGERRFATTGSAVLIDQAKQVERALQQQNKPFLLDTTIQKIGKSFQFT